MTGREQMLKSVRIRSRSTETGGLREAKVPTPLVEWFSAFRNRPIVGSYGMVDLMLA